MYSFRNDYSEGAHPQILKALLESNMAQADGYGEDVYSNEARRSLLRLIGREDLDIHFFSGGTQTNLTAIAAALRPHEAAISASTGHINVHETGAIEATGHKILTVISPDGKVYPQQVREVVAAHTDEHMVKPRLVYISDSTEIGTIYTKNELSLLSAVCGELGLFLYMDGARLGSALCAAGNDLTLSDIARFTDAFYVGGTKNGALIGEALVIRNTELKKDFRFHLKQRGGLLAKGRLVGIQFMELFRDDLFFAVAAHANKMAGIMVDGLREMGCGFLTDSPSNQIFPILPKSVIAELERNYSFYVWSKVDDSHSAIRLVTSWATPEEAARGFVSDLKAAFGK
jgi:threonine aldolase